MKDKNLLDDIKNKSLNELTELANNIIEKLEKYLNLSYFKYHFVNIISQNLSLNNLDNTKLIILIYILIITITNYFNF